MATLLGLDVSHFQQPINFPAVKAAGRDFVVLKATQGIGYTDPTFAANRKAAHAAGLVVGIYHFAQAGNPVNEAAYFMGVIGALQPGEFLVLDWETPYTGDHVAWCRAWLDAVHAKTGVAPFIYMNQATVAGHNWTPIAATNGLWLARYDNSTAQTTVPYWGPVAMKQYSDAGTVLGIPGTCDVDAFYGTRDQLIAYGTPGGTDMPLTAQDVQAVVDGLLHTDLTRQGTDEQGKPVTGTVNLAAFLQWSDANYAGIRAKVAAAASPQAIADAVVQAIGTLPAADARQVADLVLAGIAAKMNTAP